MNYDEIIILPIDRHNPESLYQYLTPVETNASHSLFDVTVPVHSFQLSRKASIWIRSKNYYVSISVCH